MATARVLMLSITETSVTVEVPDDTPEDEWYEKAVELAYRNIPPGLCHQCTGWGKDWGRDLGEPEVPEDGEPWPVSPGSPYTMDEIVIWNDDHLG